MKKSFIFGAALLACALGFQSCDKEDNPGEAFVDEVTYDIANADFATLLDKYTVDGVLTLPAGVEVTIDEEVNVSEPLTITSDAENPATIIAKAGFAIDENLTLENVNIDATALKVPVIKIAGVNEAAEIGAITLDGVNVKDLAVELIDGNKQKVLVDELLINNAVIAVKGGSKAIVNFNGGGVPETTTISNSTIYANPQHTGFLFTTQSGQKVTEFGSDKIQTLAIENSTLFNIAYGKNVTALRQNSQKWETYVVKNSIILDCGKEGQFIKGLNGGGQSPNPTYVVENTTIFRTVSGEIVDKTDKENTNGAGTEIVGEDYKPVTITFADAANGDFTQSALKAGDPRWIK